MYVTKLLSFWCDGLRRCLRQWFRMRRECWGRWPPSLIRASPGALYRCSDFKHGRRLVHMVTRSGDALIGSSLLVDAWYGSRRIVGCHSDEVLPRGFRRSLQSNQRWLCIPVACERGTLWHKPRFDEFKSTRVAKMIRLLTRTVVW